MLRGGKTGLDLRLAKRVIEESRAWRRPSRTILARDLFHENGPPGRPLPDEAHSRATIAWVKAAQDAGRDGGVAGRYRLGRGFTRSYPETTGYLIPTVIELAARRDEPELLERAGRMVRFLLRVQRPDGSFGGGEVGCGAGPVVFNTAQAIQGLVAWFRAAGEREALEAAIRAGLWMTEVQDLSGAFIRFGYGASPTTYHAQAAWPLAECGVLAGDERMTAAAWRCIEWVLAQVESENGFVERMGFFNEDHASRRALTHTIGYTYRGILETATLLGRDEGFDVVCAAAEGLLRSAEARGRLAAVLDHEWRPLVSYTCLTGNLQVALVWMEVGRRLRDPRFLNGALRAIELVKRTQVLDSPFPGLNGAVAGSHPVWGDYLRNAFPNWAAKYFLDALVAAEDRLEELRASAPDSCWEVPDDVPRASEVAARAAPARARGGARERRTRVVVLSAPGSPKGGGIVEALVACGVVPSAVVVDTERDQGGALAERLVRGLRSGGPAAVIRRAVERAVRRIGTRRGEDGEGPRSVEGACARHGIPLVRAPGLNRLETRRAVVALAPDLMVLAGTGILGPKLLAIPALGTLNAHMGVLPRFRGKNVAEWAALLGGPIGASVHFVDAGIDTGPVVAAATLDEDGGTSGAGIAGVAALREAIDELQVKLLCLVVRAIADGRPLRAYRQPRDEGKPYYLMHDRIRDLLEARLRSAAARPAVREERD